MSGHHGPAPWVYSSGAAIFGLILIALIAFFIDLGITQMRPQFIAFYTAAIFVFISFTISMATIWGHFANYRNPRAQAYVVRIIALVPLYSIQSWLSLRFHDFALFFGATKDCYEAYVIFSFFAFLQAVQGGDERLSARFNAGPSRLVHHTKPISMLLKPWPMGGISDPNIISPFLIQCQTGVLQYVVLKLVLTAVSFLLEWFGLFGEGEFTLKRGWIYISACTNLSQMWAMYCLLIFYTVCANELKPVRPVGKLLAVKAVVFFTYSQSCMIAALHWFELLPSAIEETGEHWSTEDVGRALQDYLICIEMLIAAIVFTHVFSHREYKEDLDLDDLDERQAFLEESEHRNEHSTYNQNIYRNSNSSGDHMPQPGHFTSPMKSNRGRTTSRDTWSTEGGDLSGSLQVVRSTTM